MVQRYEKIISPGKHYGSLALIMLKWTLLTLHDTEISEKSFYLSFVSSPFIHGANDEKVKKYTEKEIIFRFLCNFLLYLRHHST